jgi:hypothetical protein
MNRNLFKRLQIDEIFVRNLKIQCHRITEIVGFQQICKLFNDIFKT